MMVTAALSVATIALICQFALALPTETQAADASVDFFPVANGGGSMLDKSGGLGEPLNVIISAKSSSDVLTKGGLTLFAQAIGFSTECLGLHIGDPQTANLGDGNGDVNEMGVWRADFGNIGVGTCLESFQGGNHFRAWTQNGSSANSGALFLAVSKEEDLSQHHIIIPDGYNIGRDELVAAAVGTHKHPILPLKFTTTSTSLTGLLAAGTQGVNHNISQDGIVKLLTVSMKISF